MNSSKRTALKSLAFLTSALTMPKQWVKPVVDSVILPAHAQTSTAVTSCTLHQTGTLGDDLNVNYYFTISQLPADITATVTNNMVQPSIKLYKLSNLICNPASCGGLIPNSNHVLTLSYTFATTGTYVFVVENFNTGGTFTLDGTINGDPGACATWSSIRPN